MTRISLPAEVPADNRSKPGVGDDACFAPPEMAVPRFAGEVEKPRKTAPAVPARQDYAPSEYEDDDEEDRPRARSQPPTQARNLTMMIVIVSLIGLLGVIVFAAGGKPLPLCSEQPEWNQYNCRVD